MTAKRNLLALISCGLVGTLGFGQTAKPIGPGLLPPPPPSSTVSGPTQPLTPPVSHAPDATAVLTAQPGLPAGGLPPGSVTSPWCGGSPAGAGCCGPYGANGPISYELYFRTGPSILVGEAQFAGTLHNVGWNVAVGGRSLFLDKSGDAAWVLDFGLGYTYHSGDRETVINALPTPRFVGVQTDSDRAQNPSATPTTNIDTPIPAVLQRVMLTTFNYAVGRDWWLNGPAAVGAEQGWNSRVGFDVGGRWGTAHSEFIPLTTNVQYFRRQGITHSLFLGTHWTAEVPMGAWILFGGARAEWGKTWTNLIPPNDGDMQNVNLLLSAGIRF